MMTTTPIEKPEPNCRIGRVRLRNGAEVRVFERSAQPPQAEAFRRDIVEHAQFHAREWPRMAGYVMLVWDAEGEWSLAYRNGKASPAELADLATFVADRVRMTTSTNYTISEMDRLSREPPPGAG